MIVQEKIYNRGDAAVAEMHEGAERITLQEIFDWAIQRGLDPTLVHVTPEFTCYGEDQEHDKHVELSWTPSDTHPFNRPGFSSPAP